MRLTLQSRNALRVLVHCAGQHPNLVKVAAIATATGITKQNVFKLVKALARAELVQTARGPNGGVRLAKTPDGICLGQIIRSTEPRFLERPISKRQRPGSAIERELEQTINGAIMAFVDTLDKTSLETLASGIDVNERS